MGQSPDGHQANLQRIFPQLVVIAEVFIAERQHVYALSRHLCDRVRNEPWRAMVLKASGQARQQVQPPIRFPQQHRAGTHWRLEDAEDRYL